MFLGHHTKKRFLAKASSFSQDFESLLSIRTRRWKIGHSLSVCTLDSSSMFLGHHTKKRFFAKTSSFKQYFKSLLSIQTRRGKIGHSL